MHILQALMGPVRHGWNITVSNVLHLRQMHNVKEQSVLLLSKSFESDAYLDEPTRLIIRLSSDSVFVKLMQNMAK